MYTRQENHLKKTGQTLLISKFFLLISFLFFKTGSAQTPEQTFNQLICKEWTLAFYEEDGYKQMPSPGQKNDRMFFYTDHKYKSVEGKLVENGVWQFDSAKKMLIVVDNVTKEKLTMKVISITSKTCVLEYKDFGGVVLRMHMVSAK